MSLLVDVLIALWVMSGLTAMVIAIGQGRPVLPWIFLVCLTGPVAPVILVIKGFPQGLHGNGQFCSQCFARLTDDDRLCPRCRGKSASPPEPPVTAPIEFTDRLWNPV